MKIVMTIVIILVSFNLTYLLALWEAEQDHDKIIYNHLPRWLRRGVYVVLMTTILHLIFWKQVRDLCYGDVAFNHIACNSFLNVSLALFFTIFFNLRINKLKDKEFDYLGSVSGWDKTLKRFFGHYYLLLTGMSIFLIMYIGYIFQNC